MDLSGNAFRQGNHIFYIINGRTSQNFSPTRGLRQGCPLSPYLFLICTQGLSSLIRSRVTRGELKGIRCHRNAPEITHLFFADDTLMFGTVNNANCEAFQQILHSYAEASGQHINFNKSSITFSPNTPSLMKNLAISSMGIDSCVK